MKALILLLAHANSEHINTTVSTRDLRSPLHLACAYGNLAIAQLLIWVSFSFIKFEFSAHNKYYRECSRSIECVAYCGYLQPR